MDCQTTAAKKIPQMEATFHAICRSILRQPFHHTIQINYMATSKDNEFAWLNMEQTGQQGNREGPSAI